MARTTSTLRKLAATEPDPRLRKGYKAELARLTKAATTGEFSDIGKPPTREVEGKLQWEYANEDEHFWREAFAVSLAPEGDYFLINADNEQDALDAAVDVAEERGYKGYFMDDEEARQAEAEGESVTFAGNHSLPLSNEFRIRKLPKEPKAANTKAARPTMRKASGEVGRGERERALVAQFARGNAVDKIDAGDEYGVYYLVQGPVDDPDGHIPEGHNAWVVNETTDGGVTVWWYDDFSQAKKRFEIDRGYASELVGKAARPAMHKRAPVPIRKIGGDEVLWSKPNKGDDDPAQNEQIVLLATPGPNEKADIRMEDSQGRSDFPIFNPKTRRVSVDHPEWFTREAMAAAARIMGEMYDKDPNSIPAYGKAAKPKMRKAGGGVPFDQLDDRAKDKARDNVLIEDENAVPTDTIDEDAREWLKEEYPWYDVDKMWWSVAHVQGDYANLDSGYLDVEAFAQAKGIAQIGADPDADPDSSYSMRIAIRDGKLDGDYQHEYSDEFWSAAEEDLRDLNLQGKLYRHLRDAADSYREDDVVDDYIEQQGVRFNRDGSIFDSRYNNAGDEEDFEDLEEAAKPKMRKAAPGKVGQPISVNMVPDEAEFVSDSQEADAIKESLGPDAQVYDSFFVIVGDGDYEAVWGMVGIVPYNSKLVTRLV